MTRLQDVARARPPQAEAERARGDVEDRGRPRPRAPARGSTPGRACPSRRRSPPGRGPRPGASPSGRSRIPPRGVSIAVYTTVPTGRSIRFAQIRSRNASAPGPSTRSFTYGVMSNRAARLARGQVLGPHDRRPLPRGPARRGAPTRASRPSTSGRFAANNCGRSQPAPVKNSAPSSTCRAMERRQPQVPRRRRLLERMQDVVDLAVLLRAARHARSGGVVMNG